MRFRQWITESVQIGALDKRGYISFFKDGMKYVFLWDAGFFENGWFAKLLKQKKHQEAFDAVMKEVQAGHAKQLEPVLQQQQTPDPPNDEPLIQGKLF